MGQITINNCIVTQIISEIRFPPAPNFFEKNTDILQRLMKDLPIYNFPKIDLLEMHTKEFPGASLNLSPNRLGLDIEFDTDKFNFVDFCKDVWQQVSNKLNINFIERFGSRAFLIKEMDQTAANEYIKKFISSNRLKSGSDLLTSEITLVFRELNNTVKISFKSGGVRPIIINADILQEKTKLFSGILVDVDYFVENIKASEVNSLFSKSFERISYYISTLFD